MLGDNVVFVFNTFSNNFVAYTVHVHLLYYNVHLLYIIIYIVCVIIVVRMFGVIVILVSHS